MGKPKIIVHNPMLDDIEREFLDAVIEYPLPELDTIEFLKYYHEDGLFFHPISATI